MPKFARLKDFGAITVPDNYVHATALANFAKKNCRKFIFYNDDISDANFSNPSRILKAGDVLYVSAWEQTVGVMTSSTERMGFLRSMDNVFTGAQGAALVFEQKRDLLQKRKWYSSFDEPDRLWKDASGIHRVPYVYADSYGDFSFSLSNPENDWGGHCVLLCFRDKPLET